MELKIKQWAPDENFALPEDRSYDSNPDRSVGSDTFRAYNKSDSENDFDFYEDAEPPEDPLKPRTGKPRLKKADPMAEQDQLSQQFTRENAIVNSLHKY